jgi:chemotaxis signal transduction protein
MAPDLSEKLLGIDIDDADRTRESGDGDDEEELVRFVFATVGDHRLALPVDAVRTVTKPSTELTRVPRSPDAIAGLLDLRGEITAVIDPRVHFPTDEEGTGKERLLVLDRPNDEQSAAIHVDDVIGVESVPVSDVIDEDGVEASDLSGDALEHPLVVALVEQERESSAGTDDAPMADEGAAPSGFGSESGTGAMDSAALSATEGASPGSSESVGERFEIGADEADAEPEQANDDSRREVVVEVTPVIDVERLLLASGQA